jgi:hypothetical protein
MEIWSAKLVEKFYASTVLSAISNTDYKNVFVVEKLGELLGTPNVKSRAISSQATEIKGGGRFRD